MKTIKVNNKELLLVPVRKNAHDFGIIHQRNRIGYFTINDFIKIDLPSTDYEIVNTLSKLTEEQAKELMPKIQNWREELYVNYNADCHDFRDIIESAFDSVLESFNSLMIANEIDTNNEYLILIKND